MIVLLASIALALAGDATDATHETLHRACECAVYAIVAPHVRDDAVTRTGEVVASLACRADGAL